MPAFLHSFRAVLVVAAVVFVALLLLWLPVLADRFTGYLSKNLPKQAPRILLAGSGILVIGLIAKLVVLDAIGAVMIGGLVLAWIFDNY